MDWFSRLGILVIDSMVVMTWHHVEKKIIHLFCRFVRQRLGHNIRPTLEDIEVVHKSPNYIIVNKRYDVLINSDSPNDKVTVQTQLKHLFPSLANPKLGHEFLFAHRLDYATSGLMCISVHKKAASVVTKCFVHKRVDKYYLALVRGHVSKEMLDIYLPIGSDTREEWKGIRMGTPLSPYVDKCKTAHTRLLVLQRGLYNKYPATKILLKPITGRRHQLRVHLSESGHTIVGDFTYSNRRDMLPFRMFLHAFRLIIPTEFEHIDVRTPDPFLESDPRVKWTPIETVNELTEETFAKLKLGRKLHKKT